MTFARYRGMPEAAVSCIHEAVQTLGYFDTQRAADLVEIYRKLWPNGVSATSLIYNKLDLEDLSLEEKEAAHLGRGRIPRTVWRLLTEKGRADPMHACKATHLRMRFNLSRIEFDNDEHWAAEVAAKVSLSAKVDACCAINRERNGMVLDRRQRFALPLPQCQAEWCPCAWDNVPDQW